MVVRKRPIRQETVCWRASEPSMADLDGRAAMIVEIAE